MPNRHALHLCELITQEFAKLIEEKRRLGGDQRDAMALLMAARDDDDQPLSDAELIAEAMVLFIAGHETTAMTLTWTNRTRSREIFTSWLIFHEPFD